ncbi:MAG: hypothetical protein JRI23_28020 [Deltaproteobacteria bacterium]|jgi:hypothetical protein|nr:hypothetical protein [Deltaproteobacteria bacterium]MBW2535939.1 hypothetical protein [Deltaproteobacteria bacterium]
MKIPRYVAPGLVCVLIGCANAPPKLDALSDQTAFVERELSIALRATDDDGDELEFSFSADSDAVTSRASLSQTGKDAAMFRWTPLSPDLGERVLDFKVTDGVFTAQQTVSVAVVPPGDGSTSPVFVQPLGTGTQHDLGTAPCLELPVAVTDQDSSQVTISQGEPTIPGSSLVQGDGLTATWSWCPVPEQVAASSRHSLLLLADDGSSAPSQKNFLVMLEGTLPGCGEACVGDGPGDGTCQDDPAEEDDSSAQARDVDLNGGVFRSSDDALCSGDEDWFGTQLYAGETVYVTLSFQQTSAAEDLDLRFYRGSQALTPCTEASPASCDPNNGQSGTPNEQLQWTIDADDRYHVVVHGWQGAQNRYDICIGLNPGDCP